MKTKKTVAFKGPKSKGAYSKNARMPTKPTGTMPKKGGCNCGGHK